MYIYFLSQKQDQLYNTARRPSLKPFWGKIEVWPLLLRQLLPGSGIQSVSKVSSVSPWTVESFNWRWVQKNAEFSGHAEAHARRDVLRRSTTSEQVKVNESNSWNRFTMCHQNIPEHEIRVDSFVPRFLVVCFPSQRRGTRRLEKVREGDWETLEADSSAPFHSPHPPN